MWIFIFFTWDLYGNKLFIQWIVHGCDHLQTCLVDAFQAMDESQDGLINEVDHWEDDGGLCRENIFPIDYTW